MNIDSAGPPTAQLLHISALSFVANFKEGNDFAFSLPWSVCVHERVLYM